MINAPADIFNSDPGGSIKWKRVIRLPAIYSSTNYPDAATYVRDNYKNIAVGILTGEPGPGEAISYAGNFYIRAKDDQFVAATLNYSINGALDGWNVRFTKKWTSFREASTSEPKEKTDKSVATR